MHTMQSLRKRLPKSIFLLPGYGTQGATGEMTKAAFIHGQGRDCLRQPKHFICSPRFELFGPERLVAMRAAGDAGYEAGLKHMESIALIALLLPGLGFSVLHRRHAAGSSSRGVQSPSRRNLRPLQLRSDRQHQRQMPPNAGCGSRRAKRRGDQCMAIHRLFRQLFDPVYNQSDHSGGRAADASIEL